MAFIIVLIDAQAVINLNLSKRGGANCVNILPRQAAVAGESLQNFREQIEKRWWCVYISDGFYDQIRIGQGRKWQTI